jgi:hypothetical protein
MIIPIPKVVIGFCHISSMRPNSDPPTPTSDESPPIAIRRRIKKRITFISGRGLPLHQEEDYLYIRKRITFIPGRGLPLL